MVRYKGRLQTWGTAGAAAVSAISDYLKRVEHDIQKGISTEHTYRPALETLIESMADGIDATNEPKRVACGAPGPDEF